MGVDVIVKWSLSGGICNPAIDVAGICNPSSLSVSFAFPVILLYRWICRQVGAPLRGRPIKMVWGIANPADYPSPPDSLV